MNTKTRRVRTFGAMAAAVVLLVTPLMAAASGGGTISFAGAVVAPQLRMTAGSVSAAAPAAALAGAVGAQAQRPGSGLTLTFSAPPGVTAGADVALQVNDGAPARDLVAARFVDSGGRVAIARNGHYQVGRDGGVLSLSPKHAETDTRVTVIVSYD